MEKIVPPIRPQDHGPTVANLQEALLFSIEKRDLKPNNVSLAQWTQVVAAEMAAQFSANEAKHLFAAILYQSTPLSPVCTCDRKRTGRKVISLI
jgi:hypothetical protein